MPLVTTVTVAAGFHREEYECKAGNASPPAPDSQRPCESHQDADSHSGTPAPCDQGWNQPAGALPARRSYRAVLHDVHRAAFPRKSIWSDRPGNRDPRPGESAARTGRTAAAEILGAPGSHRTRPQL